MLVLSIETAGPVEAAALSSALADSYTAAVSGRQIKITLGRGDHNRMLVTLFRTIEDCLARHRIGEVTLGLKGNSYVVRATP